MKVVVLVTLFMIPIHGFAGAWGVGSFENDSALDWAFELDNASSTDFLLQTFSAVPNSDYLQIDSCSAALAAADVVASMLAGTLSHLPEDVHAWASNYSAESFQALRVPALEAVSKCLNVEISEVAQLWDEAAPEQWSEYTVDLLVKLN